MLVQAKAAIGDLPLSSAWAASTDECRAVVAATQSMINRLMVVQARHARELSARGAHSQQCETSLVEAAEVLEPSALRLVGQRVLALVAPEVGEEALARKLEQDEKSAYERRGLTLSADRGGEVRLRGLLDVEAAAIIRAALDPLSLPRPVSDSPTGNPDERTAPQRRADALVDICRAVPAAWAAACGHGQHGPRQNDAGQGNAPAGSRSAEPAGASANHAGGQGADSAKTPRRAKRRGSRGGRAQLCVTVTYDPLRQALGIAMLDTGEALCPTTARRLACDAAVLPSICDGLGLPLDVGRARRLFTGSLRRALALRDRGCAFPNCDRPPTWCDGHHLASWTSGGETSLANGVLLCWHHHRTLHETPWTVRIAADGFPEFIPPAYVGPLQRPMRNRYHMRT